MQYEVEVNGRVRRVNIRRAEDRYVVDVDDREWTIDVARIGPDSLSMLVGTASYDISVVANPASGRLTLTVGTVPVEVSLNGRRRRGGPGGNDATTHPGDGPQRLKAPMPGKVVRILVEPGEAVRARQPLVVIEAMKMENELRSGRDGVVSELHVREGQSVDAGVLVAVVRSA